jgi:hypothetical protein
MNDEYTCRICFEDFSDRNKVIVPCKCSGTQKYVCKECLNAYLNTDSNNIKYTTCPSCKSQYVRELPDISLSVNDEVRDEVLYGLAIITVITLGFLDGVNTSVYIFFVLCLYFYTICVYITSTIINVYLYYFILLMYFFVLFTPRKISRFIYCIWTIFMFSLSAKRLICEKWDLLLKNKVLKFSQNIKCQMFDFDIHRYVPGIV